jgi:hypothetical protein
MDSFQLTVLSIFVVLAILILVGFSIMLNSKKDGDTEYPTSYSNCPDYWDTDANGNCLVPASGRVNSGKSGYENSSNTPGYSSRVDAQGNTPAVPANINFKDTNWDTLYSGIKGRCALKKWANQYSVVWDGVNNYNSAYC